MSETEGLLLQSKHLFEIDTTPSGQTPTWARVAAGLNSFDYNNNDEIEQDHYLDGDGFAETDVVGAQLVLEFSGHRKYGDSAQDYIFSKTLTVGNDRKTKFKWTQPNGEILTGPCTICNIEGPGGDSNSKGEISFEIHFNGKPVKSQAPTS